MAALRVAGQSSLTPTRRRILALALPALGSLAADPLLSLVDTAFVARLGTVPLAALGVDAALFGFAFAVFNFLAYATTPMVAGARGRGDIRGSGRVIVQGLWLAVLIGVSVTVLGLVLARPLVGLMQAAAGVVPDAVLYLRVRLLAMTPLLVITLGHGAFRGFQDTRTPMVVSLVVNSLNAVLDPVLMFAAGWGLAGAAWATVLAQSAGAVWFVLLLRRRARHEQWPLASPRLSELRRFLRVGSGLIARTVMLVSALTMATAVAARAGTAQVAAHQVVQQVWFLLALVVDALAIAAQAMVADLSERRAFSDARAVTMVLVRWGLGLGAVLGAAVWIGGGLIGAAFSDDAAVRDLIGSIVPIAAGMQPVAALVFVLDGVYIALLRIGRLAGSTAAGLAATVAVLALTVQNGWGLEGVWWAIVAMILARAVVLVSDYVSVLRSRD